MPQNDRGRHTSSRKPAPTFLDVRFGDAVQIRLSGRATHMAIIVITWFAAWLGLRLGLHDHGWVRLLLA